MPLWLPRPRERDLARRTPQFKVQRQGNDQMLGMNVLNAATPVWSKPSRHQFVVRLLDLLLRVGGATERAIRKDNKTSEQDIEYIEAENDLIFVSGIRGECRVR